MEGLSEMGEWQHRGRRYDARAGRPGDDRVGVGKRDKGWRKGGRSVEVVSYRNSESHLNPSLYPDRFTTEHM